MAESLLDLVVAWLSGTPGDVLRHLLTALLAGGLIGLERSFHGRPAGFRTHVLVCMASAALMLVTLYQSEWFHPGSADVVRVDPTRMAQGVMTGIGFLGAGVIMKDGLSVRGLTTAASIWITSAIGILAGIGFDSAVVITTTLVLGTLSLFRWIESKMPMQMYAHHMVRFRRDAVMDEPSVRALVVQHGFEVANLRYQVVAEGKYFEYRMTLRTRKAQSAGSLSSALVDRPDVVEFRLSPTGD